MNLDMLADLACEAAKAGKLVEVELGEWKRPVGFPFPHKRGKEHDPVWRWRPETLIEYIRQQRSGETAPPAPPAEEPAP